MPSNEETPSPSPVVPRRWLLQGGVGVAAAVVLAGCGDETSPAGGSGSPTTPEEDTGEGGGGGGGEGGGEGGGGGTELGSAADVAVGSGAIFAAQQVVVTQPTEGEFRAFDTTCTHQGCPVSEVTDTINCNCHGSAFALEDGSVVSGPATQPLGSKQVTVEDGTILLS
jgi:Rieske Fe-S protein